MSGSSPRRRRFGRAAALSSAALVAPLMMHAAAATTPHHPAAGHHALLRPGNLLVSTTVFRQTPDITAGSTQLPPGCSGDACATAVAGGSYPYVFDNASVDDSFGVAEPIILQELTPAGRHIATVPVPAATGGMVTSFSSKSEGSLHLSPGGSTVTFMGYQAHPGDLDVSNSYTPGVDDAPGSPSADRYRIVGALDGRGHVSFTLTNAYSGDNGRGAILNDLSGKKVLYTAGNGAIPGDNGPADFVQAAGAQIITPAHQPERAQHPGAPTPVGSFSVDQLGLTESKPTHLSKDNNYRGMTVAGNVLYYTKGSGGKGISTVYFVDTTGKACPNGVGLPQPDAALPTTPIPGFHVDGGQVKPDNMCILKGFPQTLNHDNADTQAPFGLWFADPHTLYVADEGTGDNTYDPATGSYPAAAADTGSQHFAGVDKYVFDTATGSWKLAYVLKAGLQLGTPYNVPGYPTGINAKDSGGTGLPWAPATDGLRDITGRTNRDGSVTIYGVTSTVSGSGDQGADPNKLVSIIDDPNGTTPHSGEHFRAVRDAADGTIIRGVSFTPGTTPSPRHHPHPRTRPATSTSTDRPRRR